MMDFHIEVYDFLLAAVFILGFINGCAISYVAPIIFDEISIIFDEISSSTPVMDISDCGVMYDNGTIVRDENAVCVVVLNSSGGQ